MSIPRLIVTVVVALVLLLILVVLAFTTLLAHPTSGSGEGPFPGRTLTSPEP